MVSVGDIAVNRLVVVEEYFVNFSHDVSPMQEQGNTGYYAFYGGDVSWG